MDSAQKSRTDRTADLEAIERVIATIEHSQRGELVDEFLALFRDDAVWTTAHGKVLIGKPAIAEFTRAALPGAMAETTVSFEVAHVSFLRPDVVAVKAHQRYLPHDGSTPPDGELTPVYVMTKEGGHWLLAACQNTVMRAA